MLNHESHMKVDRHLNFYINLGRMESGHTLNFTQSLGQKDTFSIDCLARGQREIFFKLIDCLSPFNLSFSGVKTVQIEADSHFYLAQG